MQAPASMLSLESFVDGHGDLTIVSRLPRGQLPAPSAEDIAAIAQSCVTLMLCELERRGVRPQRIHRSRIHAPDRRWLPALLASRDAALQHTQAVNALVMHTSDLNSDAFTMEFDARPDSRATRAMAETSFDTVEFRRRFAA